MEENKSRSKPLDPTQAAPARDADFGAVQAGVTLSEVALAAGVGVSTASRILRSQGSFSDKKRERVLFEAARLGYVPNRIAGTLASTRSKLVGIIVPSLSNIVFPDLLRGASTALSEAGFQSVLGVTDYSQEREADIIETFLSWRPAGLMLAGLEHTTRARNMLAGAGLPVVEMLDTDGDGIDIVVGYSNREAGRLSARHLLERSYRRIGYVGRDLSLDLRAAKRLEGFEEVLQEAGLSLAAKILVPEVSSMQAGRIGLMQLLDTGPPLDAIYFSNDDIAVGGYFMCLSRLVSVPEQLALFGFNGLDVGQCSPQPLSTIRTPRVAVGQAGAKLLCSGSRSTVATFDFELLVGATT